MDGMRRTVSLAPAATATLDAMDATDGLVGVTAHCDVERDLPVVGGWLNPDLDRVDELDPDLVLTSDALQSSVRDALDERGHEVVHLAPTTLPAVVESFETLGAAVGRPEAGASLAADARDRLARVRQRVAGRQRPVVYCEEWSDPPMAAGNWVPEAVAAAGGRYPFRDAGERSGEVAAETVEAVDPDHVVLHVCGKGERVDPAVVEARGWDLDAAVHVLHDDLLNQPSPRLLDGVETLAARLHGVGSGAEADTRRGASNRQT
jgi:iron complex transport system substrate-binding protein